MEREDVFLALRDVMLKSARGMKVAKDEAGTLQLFAPWANPLKPEEPMGFGYIKAGKAYVSYHLIPLYTSAALNRKIPAVLKPRKQGKTCFNFRTLDAKQIAALRSFTADCAKAYAKPIALPKKHVT